MHRFGYDARHTECGFPESSLKGIIRHKMYDVTNEIVEKRDCVRSRWLNLD
jgi:hypothetical protein